MKNVKHILLLALGLTAATASAQQSGCTAGAQACDSVAGAQLRGCCGAACTPWAADTVRMNSRQRAALSECRHLGQTVEDVCLGGGGWWAIIHDGGTRYSGELPTSCTVLLDSAIARGEYVRTIALASDGRYAFATDRSVYASTEALRQQLQAALAEGALPQRLRFEGKELKIN